MRGRRACRRTWQPWRPYLSGSAPRAPQSRRRDRLCGNLLRRPARLGTPDRPRYRDAVCLRRLPGNLSLSDTVAPGRIDAAVRPLRRHLRLFGGFDASQTAHGRRVSLGVPVERDRGRGHQPAAEGAVLRGARDAGACGWRARLSIHEHLRSRLQPWHPQDARLQPHGRLFPFGLLARLPAGRRLEFAPPLDLW